MPIVEVHMFEGRSDVTKAAIGREIAAVVAEHTVNNIDDVHVLFHEKQRNQWSRGDTLASNRAPGKKTPARPEYASISRIKFDPGTESEYLKLRREEFHPGMAEMPGFISAELFRLEEREDEYFLVIKWMSAEDAHRYHESDLHEEFRVKAMELLPKALETSGAQIVHVMDPE